MSAPLFGSDIIFYQRLLKSSGFYSGPVNGVWGSAMSTADDRFQADAARLKQQIGAFDARTEGHIATLHIKAQKVARKFMAKASSGPLTCKIISGTRSYAEQDALYKKGRWGNPGSKVTNARGGQSNHNFCIAWDIGLFDASGKYLTGATKAEQRAYEGIAALAADPDLEWGGNWSSFKDRPHYQARTGKTTSQVRGLFEAGRSYL